MGILQRDSYPLLFSTDDLYHSETMDDAGTIRTYYEKIWLEQGKKICYLKFTIS